MPSLIASGWIICMIELSVIIAPTSAIAPAAGLKYPPIRRSSSRSL